MGSDLACDDDVRGNWHLDSGQRLVAAEDALGVREDLLLRHVVDPIDERGGGDPRASQRCDNGSGRFSTYSDLA